MVALPGNRLLLFGGLDPAERRLDDLWVFDIPTASWSELKPTGSARPKPRYGQALLRVEQRVMLFGGEAASGVGSDLWALRGVVTVDGDVPPSWLPLELPGAQPPARKGHAATCMCWGCCFSVRFSVRCVNMVTFPPLGTASGQVIVMGGHTSEISWFRAKTDTLLRDVALLERSAATLQWALPDTATDKQGPAAREFHTLTALATNHRLLLFGGGNGKQIFGDAWWLEVAPSTPAARTTSAAAQPAQLPHQSTSLLSGSGPDLLAKAISGELPLPPGSLSSALQPSMGMRQLYKRVGVEQCNKDARAASDLARLGQRILAKAEPRVRLLGGVAPPMGASETAAAAWLLTGLPVEQLTLWDVELLLHLYRTQCCVGLNAALASVPDGGAAAMEAYVAHVTGEHANEDVHQEIQYALSLFVRDDVVLPGRWAHVSSAEAVRVGDVIDLQRDVQGLVVTG